MKTYTVVLAMVLLAASTVHAQDKTVRYFPSADRYQRVNSMVAEQRYLASLNTVNDGVMESALAHVAMLKLTVPVGINRALYERVTDIATTASSPEIRYKAFLTGMVLKSPELFGKMNVQVFDSPDELFAALASRLSNYYAAR